VSWGSLGAEARARRHRSQVPDYERTTSLEITSSLPRLVGSLVGWLVGWLVIKSFELRGDWFVGGSERACDSAGVGSRAERTLELLSSWLLHGAPSSLPPLVTSTQTFYVFFGTSHTSIAIIPLYSIFIGLARSAAAIVA
jgi:hypothetical protein